MIVKKEKRFMVVATILSENDSQILYEYFVWDKRDADNTGTISINKQSLEIDSQRAETDKFGSYEMHAISKILGFRRENDGEYPDRVISVWQ